MIGRLDKMVLRDVLLSALVTVAGMTFLFTALGLYQVVNRFEVTPRFSTLLSFAPSLLVSLLPFSIPVSALFAASLIFGRMRAENELLVLAAAGVAPWRPFVALIPVGLLAAAATGYVVSELGPGAYSQRHSLQRKALADFVDHPPPGPQELRLPGANLGIDISYSAFASGHFEDLSILAYSDEGLLASLTARRARIVYQRQSGALLLTGCVQPRLVQFDAQTGEPAGAPLVADRITELRMPFDFGADDEPAAAKAMGTFELLDKARLDGEAGSRSGAAGEFVRRTGLMGAGLLLPMLGALLGALVRHPNRLLALGAGVVPANLLFFPTLMAAQNLAETGALAPWSALALPTGVSLVAMGVLLHVHRARGWA